MSIYKAAESIRLKGATELTVMTPIRRGLISGEIRTYEERLRSALQSLKKRAAQSIPTPIGQIPTIHFARWYILRPEQYLRFSTIPHITEADPSHPFQTSSRPPSLPETRLSLQDPNYRELTGDASDTESAPTLPSWLVFTSNFDGDLKAYIREFSSNLATDLDLIWSNCEGYPDRGAADFETFWAYIQSYQLEVGAFFAAYPELTTPRIQQLAAFKDAFDAFVVRTRNSDGTSVETIGRELDAFIQLQQAYTQDFPDAGGLYDAQQADRRAALERRKS